MTERVFQAIDLDRTLFDTARFERKAYKILEQFDPEISRLAVEESRRHAAAGRSFQVFSFLQEHLMNHYDAYVDTLMHRTKRGELLLPGAAERLAYADSLPEWQGGVLTYGQPEGQEMKLRLAGLLEYPHLITDTYEKGELISSWQQADGSFRLPDVFGGETVDVVTLDDDKMAAFEKLPANAYGNWVVNQPDIHLAVPAALENRVKAVPDLFASVRRLDMLLREDKAA